jgi:hypothetical protein
MECDGTGPALQAIRGSQAAPPPNLITIAYPTCDGRRPRDDPPGGQRSPLPGRREGPEALRVTYRTGTLLPAHVTSGGKCRGLAHPLTVPKGLLSSVRVSNREYGR